MYVFLKILYQRITQYTCLDLKESTNPNTIVQYETDPLLTNFGSLVDRHGFYVKSMVTVNLIIHVRHV